jgi:Fe2+ transport system protein FeoA
MSATLWDMSAGQSALLTGYSEELEQRYLTRLMELGFHPGERVVCVNSPRFGAPKVYRVSNSVFSIEDTIARQVRTAPVQS